MSWTKVSLDPRRNEQVTSSYDTKTNLVSRQAILTYVAIATDNSFQAADAEFANDGTNSIPVNGSTISGGSYDGYQVVQILPKRVSEAGNVFEVQVTLNNAANTGTSTNWNIDVKYTSTKSEQPAYQDKDDNSIVNFAFVSYPQTVNETLYDARLEISYQTTSPPNYDSYLGKVNSDSCSFTIKGLSRSYTYRQLKFDDCQLSANIPVTPSGGGSPTQTWNVNLVFLIRYDQWIDNFAEQSFVQLKSDGTSGPCIDNQTQRPVSSPVPLNSDGTQAAAGATMIYTPWKIEQEAAFSGVFTL